MSIMDKFMNVLRLNPDEDDDDFYMDDYYDEEEEEAPKKRSLFRKERVEEADEEEVVEKKVTPKKEAPKAAAPANKITPMRSARRSTGSMEVCVIKPTTVNDAREITETLLNNRTVVLNVEGLDLDIAQRIIDFTSGSCFAINGNLQKISNYIFIITPESVDISGDFSSIADAFDVGNFHTGF